LKAVRRKQADGMSGKLYKLLEAGDAGLSRYTVTTCFGRRTVNQSGGIEKASRMITNAESSPQRWREVVMFLVLAVVIWPFIAVAVVGGWGFLVWMWFTFIGLPGAPTGGH
jgi:nitrate reductase NapE